MESSAALPHAARELLLKGGGCAVNFECAPELCAPLRAELARSGRSVGFVRADEGFYDRMDTAAYLRLFERMAGTRDMADAALAAMGLEDARRTPLRRLTPAQRRRLSIAREIVRAPEVFYIEEPLAGQDAEGCRRILEWMDGRAVHRPVLHRGHGFHAHGLSAAGRALPFGRERIGKA